MKILIETLDYENKVLKWQDCTFSLSRFLNFCNVTFIFFNL